MSHPGLRNWSRIGWIAWTAKQSPSSDNEPAIFPQDQEIRRLRREGRITIFEHPEEGEKKQSNHLAEGSVNIV